MTACTYSEGDWEKETTSMNILRGGMGKGDFKRKRRGCTRAEKRMTGGRVGRREGGGRGTDLLGAGRR